MSDNSEQINDINRQISELPKGNIVYRNIRGARRMYLQWSEDGKRHSLYVRSGDELAMAEKVEKRKNLEQELRLLKYASMTTTIMDKGDLEDKISVDITSETRVVLGKELVSMSAATRNYGHRDCYKDLRAFLDKEEDGRICIIYGLRRTGKTFMIRQAICSLPSDRTAYIKIQSSDNMAMLNRDLMKLSGVGIGYVFIDEITLMSDFIDSASLLSDIYAASGMKIVLSGTDSLGFALTVDDELYDRAYMIHTTFIPFREYSRLLGIKDVDEYIRYGGTLKSGELDFEDEDLISGRAAFEDDETTRRYIDTSIARNIQHSLAGYKAGGHFRHLVDLQEAGELTNVINRLIEDMNHRFLLSVLERDFESHDLGSYSQIERKRSARLGEEGMLDNLDKTQIIERLKHILLIRDRKNRTIGLTKDHVNEIRQYLFALELIVDVPTETVDGSTGIEHILFSQPGMRYCQAQALVFALARDKEFLKYPALKRKVITDGILEEVRGRMLEEIVLLETVKSLPRGKRAFKLQFDVGEYDMVVVDENEVTCEIFEIKHSGRIEKSQVRHLIDKKKLALTEHRYGEIISRTVLYSGRDTIIDGIQYKNVGSYLEGLSPS